MSKYYRILLRILLISSIGFLLLYQYNSNSSFKDEPNDIEDVNDINLSNILEVDFEGISYSVGFLKIDSIDKLHLYPNFSEQLSSADLINDRECKYLVNGGFYSESFDPIGLFISEGNVLNSFRKNSTFNGVFYVKSDGTFSIEPNIDISNVKYAVQSGPLLFYESNIRKLNLNKDSSARRVLLATDKSDNVYFFVIYNKESVFNGPKLVDLPTIVELINERLDLDIKSAINLDGGAASAFLMEDIRLKEITPLGSYFCLE